MQKFRATYADGSTAGQWDNRSELDTFLNHSVDHSRHEVTDAIDGNNFTVSDKVSGRPVLIITGPKEEKQEPDKNKPDGDNTAA